MAFEIQEVLDDFGDNTKKLFKNKKFLVITGGVAATALVIGYLRNRESDEEATAYEAVGYAGYPTVGGSSSSEFVSTSEVDSTSQVDELKSYYEEVLGQTTTEYDGVLSEMESNITTLSNRLITAEETNANYQYQIEKQNAISQMRANSELYNTLSTPADATTRAALHEENKAIAEKYGWEFDASTGNWFEGNTVLYTTAKQQAGYNTEYTGGKSAASANTTYVTNAEYAVQRSQAATKGYDSNIDYSLEIVKAKESGASAETIQALQDARQAKINDKYGGVDPASSSTQAKIK